MPDALRVSPTRANRSIELTWDSRTFSEYQRVLPEVSLAKIPKDAPQKEGFCRWLPVDPPGIRVPVLNTPRVDEGADPSPSLPAYLAWRRLFGATHAKASRMYCYDVNPAKFDIAQGAGRDRISFNPEANHDNA